MTNLYFKMTSYNNILIKPKHVITYLKLELQRALQIADTLLLPKEK